jgi:hypothetical protein
MKLTASSSILKLPDSQYNTDVMSQKPPSSSEKQRLIQK